MRQPRGLVKVNGEILEAWTLFEAKNTGIYTADSFKVDFSLSGQPLNRDKAWWLSQQQLQIEIFAGFPDDPDNFDSTNLTSLILGNVDLVDWDPVEKTICLTGRDLTAPLIDTKSDQKYPNMTSSQIVTMIAVQQGLTPQVTATTTKVGVYYNIDHVITTAERSLWDLISYLAQREGFMAGVTGNTLFFGPRPVDTSPYMITWDDSDVVSVANAKHLTFSHNLTLARDIVVKVRSWNMATKAAYTKTATLKHKSGSPGEPQVYSYIIPGLTPDQAQQKAQSLAQALSLHELRMSAELPGDVVPLTSDTIQVQGTGTDFDTLYFPEVITREMEMGDAEGGEGEGGGFRMSIEAKNTLPTSEELI